MLKNANITLFNELDGKFYPTFFKGVSQCGKTQTAITSNGLVYEKSFVIRIEEGTEPKPYLPEREWRALSENERANYWTLQSSARDYIADSLIESSESFTEICKKHNVSRIYGFSDNRQGILNHWRIDAR